ncbi:MAG: LUD domain-containing protein [Deferribacterota bacterium]|nr:LUD domain-containing protein [Deferribacterota bacterium]
MKRNIKKDIKSRIEDSFFQKHLTNFASDYKSKKEVAFGDLDFNALRESVGKLRLDLLNNIETLSREFIDNASKAGCYIYKAKNGVDAARYIINVCRKHNAKKVIKSKSMTAEETDLNRYIEFAGIERAETDLGEWLIQLCNEKPSHMVIPALHKNRKQVAAVLSKAAKKSIDENDTKQMVEIARRILRSSFFDADVGITGANILIASSGSSVIVTNEGNGRLTSTIPPVHIVIAGYDKIVDNFSSASKILKILSKSTTGQHFSSYVTMVKGCNESLKNKGQKKEVHYVLLDNGRLSLLRHPILKDVFKCIRCGSCANVCPVYEVVGGHIFGDIYVGPIGLILTALYHTEKKALDLFDMCIGCKACSENCPSNIDLESIITYLKLSLSEKYHKGKIMKAINNISFARPFLMDQSFRLVRVVERPFLEEDGNYIKSDLPLIKKDFRKLPSVKKKSFTEIYNKDFYKENIKNDVFFYPGCMIEYIYPDIGIDLVKFLDRLGVGVDIPKNPACCGMPLIHQGDKSNAFKLIRKLIKSLGYPRLYSAYITLCPTCAVAFISEVSYFVQDDPSLYKFSQHLKNNTKSLNMFLEENGFDLTLNLDKKVTYHIPCHLRRGQNTSSEGLIRKLAGDKYIPMSDSDVCCGFGGTFSVSYRDVSNVIINKKLNNIFDTNCDIVITDCPACIMQIDGALKKKGSNKTVKHLSEILNSYYT